MDPALREVLTTLATAIVTFITGGGLVSLWNNRFSEQGKKYYDLKKKYEILEIKYKEREKDIHELKGEIAQLKGEVMYFKEKFMEKATFDKKTGKIRENTR